MKQHLLCAGLVGLGVLGLAGSAWARPQIASGDQLLDTNVEGCLTLADQLIDGLGVESDQGPIDRTGYFEDGLFRILCYGAGDASLAIIFASHEASAEVAASFIEMALVAMTEADMEQL